MMLTSLKFTTQYLLCSHTALLFSPAMISIAGFVIGDSRCGDIVFLQTSAWIPDRLSYIHLTLTLLLCCVDIFNAVSEQKCPHKSAWLYTLAFDGSVQAAIRENHYRSPLIGRNKRTVILSH
jgi:hypothetical protein